MPGIKSLFRNKKQHAIVPMITSRELLRLQKIERYIYTDTLLWGKKIVIPDVSSFIASLNEIMIDEIYKFNTDNKNPFIIDCGANIGLSAIYFKRRFPGARLITFEPDPALFKTMQQNLLSFGFDDVDCRNEAVSNANGSIQFHLEGGHSGMVVDELTGDNIVTVKSARLKNVLKEAGHVDFLKIDIEGHESSVVPDIAEELKKVDHFFLEYHSFIHQEQQLGEILQMVKAAGLRYYMREAFPKPFPFINREIFLKMDFLVNIFCYRK